MRALIVFFLLFASLLILPYVQSIPVSFLQPHPAFSQVGTACITQLNGSCVLGGVCPGGTTNFGPGLCAGGRAAICCAVSCVNNLGGSCSVTGCAPGQTDRGP